MVIFLKDIEEGFVFSVSEMKSQVRKVLLKGGAAVDVECVEKVGVAHVYTEGSDVYDALLNQVNNFFFKYQLRLLSTWQFDPTVPKILLFVGACESRYFLVLWLCVLHFAFLFYGML